LDSHANSVNYSLAACDAPDIKVAILDGIYKPKQTINTKIGECDNLAGKKENNSHGELVYQILKRFAPKATYYFYKIRGEDQDKHLRPLKEAVDKAVINDVDVVNISAGNYSSSCNGSCPICRTVKKLLENDITVVCSAGNRSKGSDEVERVKCPAIVDRVISVGGVSCVCPNDFERNGLYPDPPIDSGPYWIEKDPEMDYNAKWDESQNYCGFNKCVNEKYCDFENEFEWWSGNVEPDINKPDILAPVQYAYLEQVGAVSLQSGTSFAAPIVSGVVSSVLSEIESSDSPPVKIRNAVRQSGEFKSGLDYPVLHGRDLEDELMTF